MIRRSIGVACAIALAGLHLAPCAGARARAQGPAGRAPYWTVDLSAIPTLSRATPTAGRQHLTEGYLSQAMAMAVASMGAFQLAATINLEGTTLRRGELTAGASGEGYFDRRHPHSYVHELLVGFEKRAGRGGASLFAGRGFVPFGTDDPMARPFVKYPANHHLAQILERIVVVGAVSYGNVAFEASLFNGDEPIDPGSAPRFGRFADSWAARATLRPAASLELAASLASVESPEIALGGGLDHLKRSVAARYSGAGRRGSWYGLAEYAGTVERRRGYSSLYPSFLIEGSYCRAGAAAALRFEVADRAEEERSIDYFRTSRPGTDLSTLGTTRWSILTASLAYRARYLGAFIIDPFMELSRGNVRRLDPRAVFDPASFYGSRRLWLASAGTRVRWSVVGAGGAILGRGHEGPHRAGRYGVALPPPDARSAIDHAGAAHAPDPRRAHESSGRCVH